MENYKKKISVGITISKTKIYKRKAFTVTDAIKSVLKSQRKKFRGYKVTVQSTKIED